MLTEDIVALAVLRTGRPVKLELTRQEQFEATTTRHPMRVHVTLGATRDGVLTAMRMDVLSDTGAYANHAIGVLFHSCDESLAVYRCPNKRVDGHAVYTNTVPAGAFRGYGLSQTVFAVESAMDALSPPVGHRPVRVPPPQRRGAWRAHDRRPMPSRTTSSGGSYGLDQCLDAVERALHEGGGTPRTRGAGLADRHRHGDEHDSHYSAPRPPRPFRHRGTARWLLRPDGRHGGGSGTAPPRSTRRSPAAALGVVQRRRLRWPNPTRMAAATTPAPMAAQALSSPAPPPCAPPRRCARSWTLARRRGPRRPTTARAAPWRSTCRASGSRCTSAPAWSASCTACTPRMPAG